MIDPRCIPRYLAAGFGSGFLPWAPGTWGSIVGLIVWSRIASDMWSQLIGLVVLLFIALWLSMHFYHPDQPDPGWIVIDEIVGMYVTMLLLPFDGMLMIIGFILFRFFDIIKPLGIARIQSMPHGLGIVADDVLAGIYAALLLNGLRAVEWIPVIG